MRRRDLLFSAIAIGSASAAAEAAARREEDKKRREQVKLWREAAKAFQEEDFFKDFFADVEPRRYIPLENGVIPSIFIPHPEPEESGGIGSGSKTKGCPIRSNETRCKNFT